MANKRFTLHMLLWFGLALIGLSLAMTIPTLVQAAGPAITLVKGPDQVIASGSKADFNITVTNSGTVTLTNVSVTDALVSTCNHSAGQIGALAPGQNYSYTCSSQSNVTQSFVNSATASGTPEGGGSPVQSSDTAKVTVADLWIVKDADQTIITRGATANFNITVTNGGSITLTNLIVTDAQTPNCNRSPLGTGTLAPGQNYSYTCSSQSNVTQSFVNSATASGTPEGGGSPIQDTDTASVTVAEFKIKIIPQTQTVPAGSNVSFTMTISNTGDVNLTNLTLGPPFPTCDSGGGPAGDTLNINQVRTYTCNVNNVQESFINSVTVIGQAGSLNVTASDAAQVLLSEIVGICPTKMSAYWKLDEPGGPVYDDFYGGHDSTACPGNNCPTSLAEGRVHGAQTFNSATGDGINVAIPGDDAFNWDQDDSFSIEFWLKSDPGACTGPKNEVIVGRDDSATNLHWWLGCSITGGGQARFRLDDTDGGSDFGDIQGGPSIVDGVWHHVVGIRDGANSINRLYVDGVQVASKPLAIYSAGFGSASAALNIGWLNLTSGFHFKGTIDEVAIYNKVLPAGEIAAHYNDGLGEASPDYCQGLYRPTILSTPLTTAVIGEIYNYPVTAIGNPAPAYSLNLAPAGMTIAPSGLISWTPTTAQTEPVTVKASNSEGQDTQDFVITVSASAPDIQTYLPLLLK